MSSVVELRKWLNRGDRDFIGNLQFAIKAWRSIEFVLITKHEIIAEEFCRQLPALRKQLKQSGQEAAATSAAWTIVCEFLALKYAAGAIGSAVKEQLVAVLRNEARKLQKPKPIGKVFEALLVTLRHPGMQNYYKSAPDAFAGLCGSALGYLRALIIAGEVNGQQKDEVMGLLSIIRVFVKQTPQLDVFRKAFTADAFVAFAELVILLKQQLGWDVSGEFQAIVQELYFTVDATKSLKEFLGNANDESEFAPLFQVPIHALALWLEAILISFKSDTETQTLLHKFLFARFFSAEQTRFQTSGQLLQAATHYLHLLKRHDAQMNAKLGDIKISGFIGKHVQELFSQYCDSQLAEVMGLMCAAVRLEPMMFDRQLIPICVRCMLIRKDGPKAADGFGEFLCLVIDVFRRLSRADNFISQVLKFIVERLAETKLPNKMKRKSEAALEKAEEETSELFAFLQKDHLDSTKTLSSYDPAVKSEWNDISFAWPPAVGASFSRFIAGLVTKPSLIVWKTIIFSLTDAIALLKEGHTDPNTMFLVDFSSALLCQYLDGARLAEHAHNAWPLIDTNRQLTHSLLQEFGNAILGQEHSVRTMNAFLRCCHLAANFELVCFYYWPDTSLPPITPAAVSSSSFSIHPYLSGQQWTLIEQRITNFGRTECRTNINRLYLQRMRASQLLIRNNMTPATFKSIAGPPVIEATLADRRQIEAILSAVTANGFLAQLTAPEFTALCELALGSEAPLLVDRVIGALGNNRTRIAILYVSIVKQLAQQFGTKKSIFHDVDFDGILADCETDARKSTEGLVKVVERFVEQDAIAKVVVKKFNTTEIVRNVALLRRLPVEFVGVETRNLLWTQNVAMYVNAKATGDLELVQQVLSLVKVFLHFGESPALFALFTIDTCLRIFGGSPAELPLYQDIFGITTRDLSADNLRMIDDLLRLLQAKKNDDAHQHVLEIGICLMNYFAKDKNCKEHYAQYRAAILKRIRRRFAKPNAADETDAAFVARTIAGFALIAGAILLNPAASAEVDAELQAIFAIYLRHSGVGRHFGASIKLLGVALSHKATLAIPEETVKQTVDRYWCDYARALKTGDEAATGEEFSKNSEYFLKTILLHKTPEELVDLLEAEDVEHPGVLDSFINYRHKLFANIAKCQLSKAKGSMFNEIFKQTSLRVLLSIRLRGPLLQHPAAVRHLLDCQRLICTNIQIPMSVETVDDILAFLGEINIKRFAGAVIAPETPNQTTTTTTGVAMPLPSFDKKQTPAGAVIVAESCGDFQAMHSRMADVCFALVQHRHFFIVDRVPQFVAILRDLLQSVAWYKSEDRRKDNTGATAANGLDSGEVSVLADLAHRIENIVKSFVKHAKHMKRVAPYLLIYTVHLMISNEQPTTVFPKVKNHFEAICHDLISVCDHRVEGFIMRNCNEASKQLYEQLIKEYNKYHKFKGKV